MYETHYGLRAAPFQLSPDPAFYFASRGHDKALAYLRYGVQQAEGFVVVTGEVGAGKTTLVRALLAEIDPACVVAAQLTNTLLDEHGLLQAILVAFGVPAPAQGKAALLATMEAFLTGLAAEGRRALLVVDEAQNLPIPALEELRMLSNFQLGHLGLMQSFLVGQPELRQKLQGPAMEQLRQRILASYHLGPMEAPETAAYVLHRMRCAGSQGRPVWTSEALAAVHAHTGGIPRRVNSLCNRVLLAAFLGAFDSISRARVEETAREWRQEFELEAPVGGSAAQVSPSQIASPQVAPPQVAPAMPASPTGSPVPAAPASPSVSTALKVPGAPARPASVPVAPVIAMAPKPSAASAPEVGGVLALAEDPLGWSKLHALARRWNREAPLKPMMLVHPGARASAPLGALAQHRIAGSASPEDRPQPDVVGAEALVSEHHLDVPTGPVGATGAALVQRFAAMLGRTQPAAVLVQGQSYRLLQCALTARQLGVPVVRLGAGEMRAGGCADRALTAAMLDRCADLLCVTSLAEQQVLAGEGFLARQVLRVGPLVAGVIRECASQVPAFEQVRERAGEAARRALADARGFGLLTMQFQEGDVAPSDALQWLLLARHVSTRLPLIWPVTEATAALLREPALQRHLDSADIAILRHNDHLHRLALLDRARCVLSGPQRGLVEEALALGVPALVVQNLAQAQPSMEPSPVTVVGTSARQLGAALNLALRQGSHRKPGLAEVNDAPLGCVVTHVGRWLEEQGCGLAQPMPKAVKA
jgi:putative secretion ATPase (PEP-CTERM system associated)